MVFTEVLYPMTKVTGITTCLYYKVYQKCKTFTTRYYNPVSVNYSDINDRASGNTK